MPDEIHETPKVEKDLEPNGELTEAERAAVIARARKELPELTKTVNDGLRRLGRIAGG